MKRMMPRLSVCLLAALLVLGLAASTAALSPPARMLSAVSEDPVDAAKDFFSEWEGELQVKAIRFDAARTLRIIIQIDAVDFSNDFAHLDELMANARAESWFDYDRFHVDILLKGGQRFLSFDIDAADMSLVRARFDGRFEKEAASGADEGP